MAIFTPTALPYGRDALAPHISSETIDYHCSKHHAAYANNLNRPVKGSEFENFSLEKVVINAPAGSIFNNASHICHHDIASAYSGSGE